jgi:hypothetical protein
MRIQRLNYFIASVLLFLSINFGIDTQRFAYEGFQMMGGEKKYQT